MSKFWFQDPNVLFSSLEFFPTDEMSFNSKLNAISRSLLLVSIIAYFFTKRYLIIFVLIMCLAGIWFVFNQKEEEAFSNANPNVIVIPAEIKTKQEFAEITTNNPFGNVLLGDYDNPTLKKTAALPNAETTEQIIQKSKEFVWALNPDVADDLFISNEENLMFEQSLRQFTSNPSTMVDGGDQELFTKYLFGDTISAKEGNMEALANKNFRYNEL